MYVDFSLTKFSLPPGGRNNQNPLNNVVKVDFLKFCKTLQK